MVGRRREEGVPALEGNKVRARKLKFRSRHFPLIFDESRFSSDILFFPGWIIKLAVIGKMCRKTYLFNFEYNMSSFLHYTLSRVQTTAVLVFSDRRHRQQDEEGYILTFVALGRSNS